MSSSSSPDDSPQISRSPSYLEIPRKRAMASFENLVALANYEERLREARKIVWRDRGERPVELQTLQECLEHATKGAFRSGVLAFAIRSGVNLFMLLNRIMSIPRKRRLALIRRAAFGSDSVSFAAMIGSFVALYKFILNALPIVLPQPIPLSHAKTRSRSLLRSIHNIVLPSPSTSASESVFQDEDDAGVNDIERAAPVRGRRQARLSMSAQAHQDWVRKRTRWWYPVLAGALAGGIAINFEKRQRRLEVAQQMFVRGLQGSFNAFAEKRNIRLPHGDMILFGLCCGQIMYAFLLRPDTLPREYVSWIGQASKVPKETVAINHDLIRKGTFDIAQMKAILARPDVTPNNRAYMLERIAKASTGDYGTPFVPCEATHPWLDSCLHVPFERFVKVFNWMLPVYGALHLIPLLLFRGKRVARAPASHLLRVAWDTAKSSAFLGVFVVIYQGVFCGKHQLWNRIMALRSSDAQTLLARLARALPQSVVDVLISRFSFWPPGVLTAFALFIEQKQRREEFAMYVLPKALESAWAMAAGKGWAFETGGRGHIFLCAMGMGTVMSIYQNDPQHLSGLVRRILYQFIGPN